MSNYTEHLARRREEEGEKVLVLTAYLDHGGLLQFHGGAEGDFKKDIEDEKHCSRMLKQFWITGGTIVREDGETEPIRI